MLLRGNSGAGKSTWLALAAGLLTASAGEVAVAGQPLSALSRAARDGWRARHLGFLPQKLHLSDALSVERNLALAFYAAGLPENRNAVHRALEHWAWPSWPGAARRSCPAARPSGWRWRAAS